MALQTLGFGFSTSLRLVIILRLLKFLIGAQPSNVFTQFQNPDEEIGQDLEKEEDFMDLDTSQNEVLNKRGRNETRADEPDPRSEEYNIVVLSKMWFRHHLPVYCHQ